PTPVAVGFRETKSERPKVTVPPTPAGIATAVTAAGRTHRTDGPERSHPGFRPRTPAVAFGEESIPAELTGGSDGSTMTVPETMPAVLVAAPLAYYLGATLRVDSGPPSIDGDALSHEFEPLPDFAEEMADALCGLCRLDCRLRSVPGETGPADGGLEHLQSATPGERLAAVLESPPSDPPTWPLSTYVNDDVENGRYLPYLLDRLSLVHPASASALDPQTHLERSLDEFYRGEAPCVEAVDPSLTESRFHTWLGDGTPVDASTLVGSATPDPGVGDQLTIDVICNEPEMGGERCVADVYRRRLDAHDVDVRIHERLSTAELADVFQRPTDLVHFVGHIEVDGMVCPDGLLAATDLTECRADAFFLNACGSYYEGYDLLRQGATVGAVTLNPVLDEQAVTFGMSFAATLASGFAFDRALALARDEIIVGRDYAVVGDGASRVRQPRGQPAVLHVDRTVDGFTVSYDVLTPDGAGRRYRDPFEGAEHPVGVTTSATLARDEVVDFLERTSAPVHYDGSLRWGNELARHVESSGQQS
ncbi:MAG: hypothetical protein ACI80F_001965, partial [Natronomonas sp.]